jgi:predicted ATPase
VDALLAAYPPFLSLTGGNAAYAGSVRRICLTGGPCAGKSTCLARIREAVEARTPYKVFCVPEAATLLVGGGLNWGDAKDDAAVLQYQLALLRTQLALEDAFLRIAATCGHPAIVIADRGTMDGRCYMPDHLWDKMLKSAGFTTEALRDERYDVVIHLVSAAIGARAFYNLDNPARFEDVAAAVDADNRARRMYLGHPCVRTVDNTGATFAAKVQRAVDIVFETIGERPPGPTARHFALRVDPAAFASRAGVGAALPVTAVSAGITRTFLAGSTGTCVRSVQLREHLVGGCSGCSAPCELAAAQSDPIADCTAGAERHAASGAAQLTSPPAAGGDTTTEHCVAAHVGARWPSFFALPASLPPATPNGHHHHQDPLSMPAGDDGDGCTRLAPTTPTATARPAGAVTAVMGAAAAAAAAVAASQSQTASAAGKKSSPRLAAAATTQSADAVVGLALSSATSSTTTMTAASTVAAAAPLPSAAPTCDGCPSRSGAFFTVGESQRRVHDADHRPRRRASVPAATITATLRAVTYGDAELKQRTGRYEAMILMPQYAHLAADASPRHDVLRLCQHSFIHDGRYCQLKVYISPRRLYGLATLSVEDTVASLAAAEASGNGGGGVVPAFLGDAVVETTGAAVMEPARLAEVWSGRTLDVDAVFRAVIKSKSDAATTSVQ